MVRLHVELDPAHRSGFEGSVAIEVDVDEPTRLVELHAVDLDVTRPRIVDAEGNTLEPELRHDPKRQRLGLKLARPLPTGEARIELAFAGELRSDLCGLYGVRVGERRYAFTQLEPADARKFFPCFDEPSMKACWEISVTTSSRDVAISNAPVARRKKHADGRTTTTFETTPPLSSYLIALAVGPLERSRPRRVGNTEIRTWHVPGKRALSGFGLEAAAQTLARLERYFGIPYPYAKLDLVAVPDFEFGAMENAGAVFFRETLLLLDEKTATLGEKKRAAEVICHELAHMWYGDLVTMAWWDDLWLNEAFATWMAFHIVDEWKPEWRMWNDFQHHRAAALDLDALSNTHSIYTPVATPEEANENFDLITYEKGASVVRMLERYLGASVFRKGVRTYIRRHAEGNTVASDLWTALSEAAGRDVESIVRAWIEQEGYPVVRIEPAVGRGGKKPSIRLTQERFRISPGRPRRKTSARPPRWPVPWVGRALTGRGKGIALRHLLTTARGTVDLPRVPERRSGTKPALAVYGNAEEGGFFRPLHSEEGLRALLGASARLSPVERMGLADHQWALAYTGHTSLASFFETAATLANDESPDVLSAVQRPLGLLAGGLANARGAEHEARMRAWIRAHFGALWDELGWKTGRRASLDERLRRQVALNLVGAIGQRTDVMDEAVERCHRYLDDRSSIDANLADPLVATAALRGGSELHERFGEAAKNATTPQEQRRFLFAQCDFPEPTLIDRTLASCLGDTVATQDVAFVIARCFANPSARARAWRFVQKRWPRLRKRIAPLLIPRVVAATPLLGTASARQEVASFFEAHPVPSGERTVRQALERFDAELRFRKRVAREFDSLLDLG